VIDVCGIHLLPDGTQLARGRRCPICVGYLAELAAMPRVVQPKYRAVPVAERRGGSRSPLATILAFTARRR
jgi:hypothetical protein